jgi:hypothetical protein
MNSHRGHGSASTIPADVEIGSPPRHTHIRQAGEQYRPPFVFALAAQNTRERGGIPARLR